MLMKFAIMAALVIAGYGAESANYDAARQGQLPPGWSTASNNKWEVRADKTAPSHPNVLLSPPATGTEGEPPIAIFDKVICKDGDLSVKFRIDGSHRGAAAGIVWRYQDPNNFYLLSLNDDGNVVLHRVRNGVSEVISSGGKQDIRPGQWHLIKVAFRGPRVQVFLGNRSLFTADDSGLPAAGRTGVWVKGAHAAAFDDFRIDKKS
ncbi:MAG TPA: hypothetical protein VHC90_12195 [Bryobacteraceae bacterium]|nr:hypothetical protein [Bryobacteraceae bacterium]